MQTATACVGVLVCQACGREVKELFYTDRNICVCKKCKRFLKDFEKSLWADKIAWNLNEFRSFVEEGGQHAGI